MKIKRNIKASPKRQSWFKKIRGSYLPVTAIGIMLQLLFTSYLVFVFIISVQNAPSMIIAAIWVFPNWIAAALVMTFIAARNS